MLPNLEILEQRRRTLIARSTQIILFALAAIALILLTYSWFRDTRNAPLFFAIALAVVVITAILVWTKWARDKTFYRDFKQLVIERIVLFISPELNYEPRNFIGVDSFERSRIFLTGVDRYKGDDMVSGKVDKTEIWFSEIHAEYKVTTTDGKGRTRTSWHNIFKGLFFIADFNKHFQTSTVVLPNRLGRGAFARFFNKLNLTRREKLINLEDPEFSRYFVVYGDDQVEARYVLSTSLMSRITEFRKKHPNNIFISFVNSFLYVAIAYRKDLFEPGYFKRLTDFAAAREYFEDLQLVVSIVEELNLNNRIWTKQ